MPGIVGLITKLPERTAMSLLGRMAGALLHEPFYSWGTWCDASLGIYVGWVARRGSFSDGMPLLNEHGDVAMVFSGQEFPEPGAISRLRARGHDARSDGPSYLVHMYEEDPSFPACLNGQFHGLVADRRRGVALLFNDRYGLYPLYLYHSDDACYFSAEPKALLSVCPELRQLNARALGELVSCGCVLENRTLFENVSLLPAASLWSFRSRELEAKSLYFRPDEWEEQPVLEREAYYQRLRDVFARNLPRYFNGCEAVGMSLTAGLDSRMIMAWQKCQPASLPCYSFGGSFRECQDVVRARQVARACGQPHRVIQVGSEFLSNFDRYAERTVYLSDGCADVSLSPDLYVNEIARQIAPVRMTGNYGGEILRRLRAFKPGDPSPGVFAHDLLSQVRLARKTYAEAASGHALSFIAFRQCPWHHGKLLRLEQTQLSLRSPYLDNELVKLAYRAPGLATLNSNLFENDGHCVRLISEGDADLALIRTDRGLLGPPGHLRAAAERNLLEFTFKAEYAYDHGMPQWVALIDYYLSPLKLERLFLGRHKFNHFRVWYRDQLGGYVRDMLLGPRSLSRPYVDSKGVQEAVRRHVKGDRNYTDEIHQLLTLELLHRLFLNG